MIIHIFIKPVIAKPNGHFMGYSIGFLNYPMQSDINTGSMRNYKVHRWPLQRH